MGDAPEKPNHVVCKYCGEGCRFGGTLTHAADCKNPHIKKTERYMDHLVTDHDGPR